MSVCVCVCVCVHVCVCVGVCIFLFVCLFVLLILLPTLFNIFLERIVTDTLENHEGTVSIGSRTIINLRFADDIDGLAGEEEEFV